MVIGSVCVCVCVSMYVHICVVCGCMYVGARECEHVCGYMNVCDCARSCVCVCESVCVCVYAYTARETQGRESKT